MVARSVSVLSYMYMPLFISMYKILFIITFSMAIYLPYSVWGILRSQRNLWRSNVFCV